jgi:hypothetical protein
MGAHPEERKASAPVALALLAGMRRRRILVATEAEAGSAPSSYQATR